jgi:hypothetical protein
MNAEQVKSGAELVKKIEEMKFIEDMLGTERVVRIQIYLDDAPLFTIYKNLADGGEFVIEKMIEAGLFAAMTVRAMAENDLEKL